MPDCARSIQTSGFTLLPRIYSATEIEALSRLLSSYLERMHGHDSLVTSKAGAVYGARNLLETWPRLCDQALNDTLRNKLIDALGERAGVVRAMYFDKPPVDSWSLPWHKDFIIAVDGAGKPGSITDAGIAAGVSQAKASHDVLSTMLTARIHLDPMTAENGALRVRPGSHEYYSVEDEPEMQEQLLTCQPGDVLLMKPLLTHASSKSSAARRRRILHFECASEPNLPDGWRFRRYIPIGL